MSAAAETEAKARPERGSEEFAGQVQGMFDRIAGVYDLMNSAMTAGLHHRWRERAADEARLEPGGRALDVCCGTGDLAFELTRRVGPEGLVVATDFSERMLGIAREKIPDHADGPVVFDWADALDLPFGDAEFDAVTVGFGARNLADLDVGLAEMNRVVKPGGRVVILEITRPTRPPLSVFFGVWFDRIVPVLGRVAGDPDAYAYLPESVRSFPDPPGLASRMAAAGLDEIRYAILAGGIIAIHSGTSAG